MLPLTERQKEILRYLWDYFLENGYAPSIREIGEAFNITSPNGVMCHLRALEVKGHIHRASDKARAIKLVASG